MTGPMWRSGRSEIIMYSGKKHAILTQAIGASDMVEGLRYYFWILTSVKMVL